MTATILDDPIFADYIARALLPDGERFAAVELLAFGAQIIVGPVVQYRQGYDVQYMYESYQDALDQFFDWLAGDAAEPTGWIRCKEIGKLTRRRDDGDPGKEYVGRE